jgi:hypothetical protein
MNPDVRTLIYWLHAGAGTLVLIIGILQIVLKKGGRLHRQAGKIYLASWFILVPTGAYLGSLIITFFGIFGLYMAFTGSRMARFRNFPDRVIDKIFYVSGGLVSFPLLLLIRGERVFSIVSLVFGTLFFSLVFKDLKAAFFKKDDFNKEKMNWFYTHLGRMYISFIAATTAFLVIQNLFPHPLLNWLSPTVAGFILISLSLKHYRRKFGDA